MISAPSSSRTSWVRPLTVAWVPTGMNTGVSIGPRGVVKRPQRAPVASVFASSNEKFIFDETPESRTGKNACPTSVYQEKTNAQPTRQATNAAQTPKAIMQVLEPFSFFGFTAANPIANKIRVQNVKISKDLHSATSHFADSSGKNAARFAAKGFSRSAVP